jgi:TfoX/Sxy family transcriptional regulator of competence genes
MAYDENLAQRVREILADLPVVEEKKMFSGICLMVNDKMCVCVREHDLLCRIGEQQASVELEKGTCMQMIHGGRLMKDYVFVDVLELRNPEDLQYWINLSLAFNGKAKSSKRATKG